MVDSVMMFKTSDGKLFSSEKEAAFHELHCDFVDKFASLQIKAFTGDHQAKMGATNVALARKELGAWLVRNQDDLREFLIWYDVEKTALEEIYTKEKEAS
jgi:hypothetical protein